MTKKPRTFAYTTMAGEPDLRLVCPACEATFYTTEVPLYCPSCGAWITVSAGKSDAKKSAANEVLTFAAADKYMRAHRKEYWLGLTLAGRRDIVKGINADRAEEKKRHATAAAKIRKKLTAGPPPRGKK